jgi:hypothetical protein
MVRFFTSLSLFVCHSLSIYLYLSLSYTEVQEFEQALVNKISSTDRFSDSDDEEEDDDDDEGEFSSPTLKPSHTKFSSSSSQDIITSIFPASLDTMMSGSSGLMTETVIPTSPSLSSRLRSISAANNIPRDLRKASLHSAEILGECYEWMWHVGFKGMDPLALPQTPNITTSGSLGETLPRVDLPYSLIWMNEHIKRLENILCQIKYLLATYYEAMSLQKSFRASKLKKEVEYQAIPINLHIQALVVQKCATGSSDLNPSSAVAGGLVTSPTGAKKVPEDSTVHVIDSITCGAMACHSLGYSQGGLHNIETSLQRSKANLDNLKKQYANDLLHPSPSFSNSTGSASSPTPSASQSQDNSVCYPVKSREYEFREFLSTSIFNYETSTTSIMLRRIYCLSQILSIAINSFIYKLELVIENHISSYFFERWFSFGFLILFECLLSVNGKERAMLEDTRTAVEMIQLYHLRLLPSPSPALNHPNSSHQWYREQYQSLGSVTGAGSGPTEERKKKRKWLESISLQTTDVHVLGREVLIFVPEDTLRSLPETIFTTIMTVGAVFSLKTALFSQGIDIMQSMTNAWDSHESGLSSRDLQYQINLQGLQQLNTYCELVQPVQTLSASPPPPSTSFSEFKEGGPPTPPTLTPTSSSSSNTGPQGASAGTSTGHLYSGLKQEAHPLTDILSTLLLTTNINEKNVEMLIEVERIGRILGACRVTFCKSGKDRTGMAITLEQSRLLGENFDCGQSSERIIRDANMMRQYGTRLMVAEKNIGRAIYAINRLQIKFLPLFYRPPIQLTEDLMKKSDNS